jgi:hypothetical protein
MIHASLPPSRRCPDCHAAHPAPNFVTAALYRGLRGEPDGACLLCPRCHYTAPRWMFRAAAAYAEFAV